MSVKVAVRSRPMSDDELKGKSEIIIRMNGNEVSLQESVDRHCRRFVYDSALWSCELRVEGSSNNEASQAYVYNAIGTDLVEHIVTGYNGCIFAYGQTGSGKTYSMMGYDQHDPGLIPRIARSLFERSNSLRQKNKEVCVEVSYYEIYNEKVRCLLRPTHGGDEETQLRVREHPKYGPFVEGLAKFVITTQDEFLSLIHGGNKVRTTASTIMNATSSRSHAVFAITLTQKEQTGNLVTQKTSRLNLVDLAGSERVSKTLATGKLLAEGANINKSLTCLGNVISALAEAEESGKCRYIPYRDSTLTWILKDNLGGNSKTVMLATISPSSLHFHETLSTLCYAERVKKIVNRAIVNETNNNELVVALQKEIFALRSQLANASINERVRLEEELEASEAVKKELTSSLAEKLACTKQLMEEREEYMRQLEWRLNTQTEEIEMLRSSNEEKERRINELLQRIQSLANPNEPSKGEQMEQIQVLVAALEQERNVGETHMYQKRQQRDAVLRRLVEGANGAEHSLFPTEHSLMGFRAKEAHVDATDDVDQGLFLDSHPESADEDLMLDGEFSINAPVDSDLEDVLAEDSDLELLSNDPVLGDTDTDEGLRSPDCNFEKSSGEPIAPATAVRQFSEELSPMTGKLFMAATLVQDASSIHVQTTDAQANRGLLSKTVTTNLSAEAVPSLSAPCTSEPEALCNTVQPPPLPQPFSSLGEQAGLVSSNVGYAKMHKPQLALESFFINPIERPEIYSPTDRVAELSLPSHALSGNRFLRDLFHVTTIVDSVDHGPPKSQIWEVDMFCGRFRSHHLTGAKSFDLSFANLFRVEKPPSNSRCLTLFFLDSPQPYRLEFSSASRRQHFFELAMLARRDSVLWCPSLCLDGENDTTLCVKGTTIEQAGGTHVPVKGEVKMRVARMPYEVLDLWYGCFSLEAKTLHCSAEVFRGIFPKVQHDIYALGLLNIPESLLRGSALADYFLPLIGTASYVVLVNTASSSKKCRANNALLVFCKRSLWVRVANIELLETVSLRKEGVRPGDFTATGCSMRINESSLAFILVNAKPGEYSIKDRAACIRMLLSSFLFLDPSVDVSVRFDYLIVSGAFHFGGDFSLDDALIREILSENVLSHMREMEPSPSLSGAQSHLRIFYAARPSVSRMDVSIYSTSRALTLPNAFISADFFCQRSFLSLFGQRVPRVQLLLDRVKISAKRLPPISDAALQVSLGASEGSPAALELLAQDGGFVVSSWACAALYPCVSNSEYLRLQTLTFSLLGTVGSTEGQEPIVVGSGAFPLKSVALAEPAQLHIPLYFRGCNVGKLTAVMLEVYCERNDAELSALGLRDVRFATICSCYENQIRRSDGQWTAASEADDGIHHFSAHDVTKMQLREAYSLPNEHAWCWITDWQHDCREDDQQGWVYATDAGDDLHLSATASTGIRRRQWVRVMQANDPIVYHSYLAEKMTTTTT